MDRTRDNDAEENGATTARVASDAAATAAQRVGETLEQGKEAVAEMQAALAERTRHCMDTTEAYVRDNPWQAVGIAAGIGLVVGLLLARR